ncbi:MAG: hypothetical protein NW207_11745 [Cytophagales bacterium]|nr:hypothetical protein [Cytophagales bacterium]
MGLTYAEIELVNSEDIGLARRNFISPEDIRSIRVNALVDSGSYMLAINEGVQEYLQLPVIEQKFAELANGVRIKCDVVGPVEVKFKNRSTTCRAMVLPGDNEILLGAIPMEDMDVIWLPLKQELMVNPEHPTMAVTKLK